jgi:predicted transcriptional regulator
MDKRSDAGDDNNHVDFTDLPSLPPNEIRVLGHIIRNRGVRRSEVVTAFSSLPDDESIDTDEIDQILAELVQKRLLNTGESGDETTYRARLRRKTSQMRTIQGIWKALDSSEEGEALETGMNIEIRKTRSELANSILADMSQVDQITTDTPPANPQEAQQNGSSLLSDLTSAGRSSMSKREAMEPDRQREGKGRSLQADIAGRKSKAADSRMLDDLAATLKKQTGIHPVVKPQAEKVSLWRKLLSWLGMG